MKQILKRAIAGTVAEGWVHGARAWVAGGAAWKGFKYDRETFQVMDRCIRDGGNCIDVGAHQGEILIEMLRRSPSGQHFAFEPIPAFAAALRERFAANQNVQVIGAALSDENGSTTFNFVVSNPAYSGIRKRKFDRAHEEVSEIEVKLVRLDDLMRAEVPISFVKIDVEGAELQVLKGGMAMLKRDKPVVVFEHGLGAADVYGTGPEDVWAVLVDGCDMRVTTMRRWLAGEADLTREAFVRSFRDGLDYYFLAHG